MNKCPAVILHTILAIIVVIAAAFASHAVSADDRNGFCVDVGKLGEAVMLQRISGSSFAEVFEDMQSIDDGALASFTFIVLEAWNSPLHDFRATTPNGIAAEFGSYVRLDCTHNWVRRMSM